MKVALRFVLASFGSALAALLLLSLLLILYLASDQGWGTGEPLREVMLGSLGFAAIVIVIGGMLALPAAVLAGGALLLWQRQRGAPLSMWAWLITGLCAGAVVSLMFSKNDEPQSQLVVAALFALAGMLGAWTFRRIWGSVRL